MTDIWVNIKKDSFRLGGGKLTGIVFFRCGGYSFPDDRWDDFAAIVLTWWLTNLLEFRQRRSEECDLHFMDGPFSASLNDLGSGRCKIRFENNATGQICAEFVIAFLDVYRAVVDAADALLRFCEEMEWKDSDLQGLRESLLKCKA